MTTEKPNVAGAKRNRSADERERITRTPPVSNGAFAVACPLCGAQPGQWCEAVLTLPAGTLLRDPHDVRARRPRGRDGYQEQPGPV